MKPAIVEDSQIDQKLDAIIRKNLCICFPKDCDEFSRTRAYHGNVPLYTVFLNDGQTVRAYLAVVDRTILAGREQIHVAGVANVFVMPKYRGKGLSDVILKAAMEEAGRRGFDFGLLFARQTVKKVYARNEWLELKTQEFVTVKNGEEVQLSQEKSRMYYPLKKKEFPAGKVNLQGIDW